jgi:hypothetical protein
MPYSRQKQPHFGQKYATRDTRQTENAVFTPKTAGRRSAMTPSIADYGATIWMRTRGNQDEKRRPWRIMVAPYPDRCKPLVTVPRAAISSVMPFLFVARPDCIRLRLGRDVRWGAADMAP